MTREEVEGLSGRELDAAVAGHVLGKLVGKVLNDWYWWERPDSQLMRLIPAYSSTWQGMGMVIEAMRARGWGIEMHVYKDDGTASAWFENGATTYHADAPTLPEAMARAALLAVDDGNKG